MLQDLSYLTSPLTLSGAPKQKKRFNNKNLHYIYNAEIFNSSDQPFVTENRVRFNNSPEKWKQHNVLNSEASDAIAAGIKSRITEQIQTNIYLNSSHRRIANDVVRDGQL